MRWVLSDPREEERRIIEAAGKIGYRMGRLREMACFFAIICSDDKSFGMQELVER